MLSTTSSDKERPATLVGPTGIFTLASILYLLAFTATETRPEWSQDILLDAGLNIGLAAIVVFVWRPMFLHANRAISFIVASGLTILLFALIDELLDLFLHPQDSERYSIDLGGFSWGILNGWTAVITMLALVLFVDSLEERRRRIHLEKLEKTAQLTTLRTQLNPHILLNGLNNIYALATRNSTNTATAILELTDILRYALYETEEHSVSLAREVDLLQNYIAMQKLGLENRVNVQFDIEGPIEKCSVAPLIFLPIVENAFKHGSNADRLEPADLLFCLKLDKDEITFESSNPYYSAHLKNAQGRGVGLDNIRARLELAYKERHMLNARRVNDLYVVTVTLTGEPQ